MKQLIEKVLDEISTARFAHIKPPSRGQMGMFPPGKGRPGVPAGVHSKFQSLGREIAGEPSADKEDLLQYFRKLEGDFNYRLHDLRKEHGSFYIINTVSHRITADMRKMGYKLQGKMRNRMYVPMGDADPGIFPMTFVNDPQDNPRFNVPEGYINYVVAV